MEGNTVPELKQSSLEWDRETPGRIITLHCGHGWDITLQASTDVKLKVDLFRSLYLAEEATGYKGSGLLLFKAAEVEQQRFRCVIEVLKTQPTVWLWENPFQPHFWVFSIILGIILVIIIALPSSQELCEIRTESEVSQWTFNLWRW